MAVLIDDTLHVEDLFVKPGYRRQRLGSYLVDYITEFAKGLSAELCYWIPWGDHNRNRLIPFQKLMKQKEMVFQPSGVRWAAFKCVHDKNAIRQF